MSWFILAWQRATDFSGRSRRSEYWTFHLFNVLAGLLIGGISVLVCLLAGVERYDTVLQDALCAYGLLSALPSLAVTVRRLHDIGSSGWWYFISLVPLLGAIAMLIFLCSDSQPIANQWGLDPKASERALVPPYAMPR